MWVHGSQLLRGNFVPITHFRNFSDKSSNENAIYKVLARSVTVLLTRVLTHVLFSPPTFDHFEFCGAFFHT